MNSTPYLLAGALSLALLAGCSKEASAPASETPTPAAAMVNGKPVGVDQVEFALKRLAASGKEQPPEARLQIAKSLVEQALLVQQAEADGLDRDPEVAQALKAARNQLLAEAYLARKLGQPAEPAEDAVREYFDAHPELFAERKIYSLQEISIRPPAGRADEIRAKLQNSATLNEFLSWLRAESIPANAAEGAKPAEQLPMEILPQLAKLPTGQVMMVNVADAILVIRLAGSQSQPVAFEQARSLIVRHLQQQDRQKRAQAELDRLKAAAKIEYLGDFASLAGSAAPGKPSDEPAAQ